MVVGARRPFLQDTTAGPADPLADPSIAGRPRAVVTAADNLERVKEVERKLKCTCGCNLDIFTCRTTDFTCTVSPALHQEVLDLDRAGVGPDRILTTFVAKYGEAILMAPPARGFNLVGYLLPGLAVVAAGMVLGLMLLRNRGRRNPEPSRRDVGPVPEAPKPTPEELDRVRAGLEEIR
jgi:cytochrome c-type biogenesis protein CcmH